MTFNEFCISAILFVVAVSMVGGLMLARVYMNELMKEIKSENEHNTKMD